MTTLSNQALIIVVFVGLAGGLFLLIVIVELLNRFIKRKKEVKKTNTIKEMLDLYCKEKDSLLGSFCGKRTIQEMDKEIEKLQQKYIQQIRELYKIEGEKK